MAALQEWIVQATSAKKERYMAFLDIKAAYDQVDRDLLWPRLEARGVPDGLIQVLKALFDGNTAFVAINGNQSTPFPISSGVLQGSLLSPLLYSLFIDDLIESINKTTLTADGILLGGRRYLCLLYADDIVLLSTCKRTLNRLLAVCEEHSCRNRYVFSVTKCVVVTSDSTLAASPPKLYDTAMPIEADFVYLGCTFNANGIDWTKHWKRITARALSSTSLLTNAGINGRNLGVNTSLAVFRTFIRPILEYGLGICPKTQMGTIQKAYNRCLGWITSAGQGASSAVIGLFGNIEPFEARQERLSYGFHRRLETLSTTGLEFAALHARSAYSAKKTRLSSFVTVESSQLVHTRRILLDAARAANLPIPDERDLPQWKERRAEIMMEVPLCFRTGYIFGGRNSDELKTWSRSFGHLCPPEQRNIFLWCLNRTAGKWIKCHHCPAELPATKSHLELCAHGLASIPIGPSLAEDALFDDPATDTSVLRDIAQRLQACVGNRVRR